MIEITMRIKCTDDSAVKHINKNKASGCCVPSEKKISPRKLHMAFQ